MVVMMIMLLKIANCACADGTLDDGEECDDGETTNGDGCASDCTEEDGYTC